ncbi:hypothetical protein V5O48_014101 [Marasmius crinis-equi]|uniref:Uncharacterized protein n=1 Tax=Marasmius crinis-equi TaxID=585013 RepID=A0ABR3EYN0_9AGAR
MTCTSPEILDGGIFRIPDEVTGELREVRVTVEENRIVHFLMDPLVDRSALGPVWVRCLPCGKRVGLKGNTRFHPDRWLAHRGSCVYAQDALKTMEREGRFRPTRPLGSLLYADKSEDKQEALRARGVYSRNMLLLRQIAHSEAKSGRSPWTAPPSPPPLLRPLPLRSGPSTSSSVHPHHQHQHHQHQHHHQQRASEMTRPRNDSLTLPPLQNNPPAPVLLPSVQEVMMHANQSRAGARLHSRAYDAPRVYRQ